MFSIRRNSNDTDEYELLEGLLLLRTVDNCCQKDLILPHSFQKAAFEFLLFVQ